MLKTNTTGFVLVALLVLMIGAVGCGGGGGGGGTPTPTPPSSGGGFMVKGVVTAGTVNAYLFDASKASGKGALITGASGSITTPGKFTLTLPTSAANKDIVVEVPVLGSLYVDNPATPAVTTVLPKPFLSGFHYGGENPFVANVTALNYLAYAKALSLARSSSNTNSFAANLAIANSAVAAIFNTTVDSFTTSADPTNIVTQRVDALRAAGGSASNKSFDVLDGLVQAIVGSGDDTTKEFVAGGTANLTGGNTPQTVLSNAVTTNATGGSTVPALLTVQSVTFGLPGGLAEVGRTGSTQASMTVKNLGAQNAIVRSATLAFRDAGLTGVYVSPTPLPVTVGGGATATFSFTVNASAQATLGSTGAEFGIIADGATAGSASAGSLQANALTILAGNTPDLTVTGITLSQTAPGNLVRPDGTFTASIAVLNRGGAAAVNVLGRLTSASSLPFAQQQQNTVASLAPGNTANILVTVTGTGANTPDGAYNVTARADSTDSLNNAFSGTGGAASFTVRSVAGQASLTVAANPNSGTLPSANGGPGFDSILTATVRNLGAATGSAIGNITVTPPSITGVTYSPATQTIATIAGQGSADVTFTAHFAQTASPVATPITLTASGTDADSGVAVFNESTGARTASGSATVTVNLPAAANLSIGSFSAPASARQNSSFVASYRVSNGGGTDTTINSGTLTFSVAGVSATLRQAGLGLLPAGGTITLTYDVTVSNTASFSNNPCTASATVGGSDTYARSTPGSNNALGSIDILIGPRANLSSVTETPGIPSIRKTILTPTTISFTVNNTGDGDATVSAVSLSSISGVSKSLVGNQIATVAANSTSTVQYNFTADESAALQTNTPLTLTVTFSDLGGTEPTAVLSAGTLTVAEGPLAHFVVSSTTPGTVQLDQGAQTTFTMTVTNDGDADATGLSLAVSLGSASGVTFTTDTAPSTTLTAGAATTATYRVAASNTATPGSYTISGIARGTDPRPTGVRSTTNAGAGTLSVNLVPRALFSISNASFSTGTVQVGKTFSVDVTVTNTATADGSISGATLTFDGSTALQASLASPAVPITVTNGAAGQKFTFSGTSTSAATGVQNASLSITATGPQGDVSTGRLNIGSVTVVPAPALSIVGIAFSGAPVLPNLSVGQGASIGVNVANTGTGKAFGLSGFAVVRNPFNSTVLTIGAASGPLDVAAGTTVTYSFPVTAASAGAVGITSMIFSGGYPILANTTVGDGVTVTAAPVVTVVNLTPSAQTVSRGQSAVTVLRIHNAGPGSINFSGTLSYGAATGIVAAQRGGSVNVAEGADGTATFDVLATNSAALGTDNVSVTVNGVANDTGFGVTASATNAGTLTVQLVPVVTIGTGTVTSSPVTRGNNITFTFPVSTPVNSAIADITGITVTATDTVFTADVANATTLTADSPATLTFTGAVSGSATPGNRTIGITVSYNDDNTGTAQTDATNSASGFLVQTVPTLQSANLAFTSQSGKSNRVSLGQAANVSFDVGNATGSATARITGVVSSWITNGLTLVSESSVSSLTPIAASNTKTYSASLKVPANLTPGPITATVVFQATDVNTNLTGYDITQSIPFTAQTTATNVTGAVTTLPASVAEGETGAQLLTTLTNNTPNSPAVNFNSVTWQAFRTTDSADVTNKFIFSNPSLPQVAKGSPKTVTYTFDVDISAPITSVTLRPIFAGTDEATGAAVTITPISGDLAVTGPKAVLSINSMTLSTNIVSQGQAFTAALNVSNRGASPADLSFGPNPLTLTNGGTTYGSSDFTSSKTDLASQINSNSTTILSFTITPTTASTPVGLTIDITATIPATNHADATNVSITGTSLASFLLQSRSQVVDRLTSILSTNPPAPDRFDASDQDGSPITATATFSVPADGAPLRVDSCDVALANGVTDVGAQFTVNKLTTFPFTVGAGQTKSVTFTVKATAAAVEGEVIALTATFAGTDTNSGVQTTAKADQRFGVRDAATFVIGEPDLNTSTAGTTASAFTLPWASLAAKGPDGITRLFVADTGNNRVLIFQPLPSVVNTAATTVLGEPSFVTGTVNRNAGQTTDNGMSAPKALWVTGTTLIVADTGNNRVLIYNDYTTLAQRDATPDREIGQISFFTGSANKGNAAPDANTLSAPVGVAVTGSGSAAGLVVADSGNNRVLVYNSLSALDRFGTVPADKVFGQPDFLTNTVALTTTAGTVNAPLGVTVKANQLFVADTGNNRVLVFNDVTNLTNTNATSDVVLGQADGTGSSANRGGSTAKDSFNQPTSTYVAGNNLFVVDSSNNRVVVYPNASGITNTSLPTGLIGQQYYTDNGANNVNVSAIVSVPDAFSLRAPRGGFASSTGTVFWPADTGNNRLIKVPLP